MFLNVVKDVYLNNFSKTTHYAQNHLLLVFPLFFENSSSKASGLFFIFVCVSTDHANDEMPIRPSMVVFGCRMPEKSTRKADLKVCELLIHQVFNSGKKLTFKTELTCAGCFHICILTHMHTCKYTHTHFS